MIRFDTDDILMGERPGGLPEGLWEFARDICEQELHENFVRFRVPEGICDLDDACPAGGMLLANTGNRLEVQHHAQPFGEAAWAVTMDTGNYTADVLIIADAGWLPTDIREALLLHQRREEGINA